MNSNEYRQIEERLRPAAAPEPPEGLLEKIQEEIPQHLKAVPEPPEESASRWRVRLLAASVMMAVLSGVVVYQVLWETPDALEEQVARQQAADNGFRVEDPRVAPGTQEGLEDRPSAAKPEADAVDAPEVAVSAPASPAPVEEIVGTLREVGPESVPAEPRRENLEPLLDEPKVARQEAGPSSEKKTEMAAAMKTKDDEGGRADRDGRAQVESQPVTEAEAEREVGAKEWTPKSTAHMNVESRPTEHDEERAALQRELKAELRSMARSSGDRAMVVGEVSPSAPPASTGGTAEPNDAPYGDMFFRSYGTNPFIDTEDDPQSTFGLDVDTGSFTLARSYLDRGHLPPPEAIRVEEFVNYFDYGDPQPGRGEFTLVAEGAPSPFASGPRYHLVRFGIQAMQVRESRRLPATLIFVVDVSGSMGRENRLGLVQRSLHLLLDQLDDDDRIGLVVYGSRGEVLLEPTHSREAIRRAIDRLAPAGSTNAEEGLELAYELARRYYREGEINRLILCSDGVANVGRTGPESILERARDEAEDGIELTTVGFGMGNYNDVLMEQLADRGDGSYAYVDTLDEARRIFVENLTGTLQTIAADAKVQVEFNPDTVSRYRLLGYENRDIPDERFRDDSVDAGEIGAGHSVTALYEIKLHEGVDKRQRLATLRLRYRSKAADEIVETSIDLTRNNLSRSWERSSTAVRLSSLAAEFAEILKGSYWARESDLDDLHRRLRPLAEELRRDDGVQDLLYLVEQARSLGRRPMDDYED